MTSSNRLLDGLPAETWRALRCHLHEEPLRAGQTLVEPGRRVEHVFFPISGIVSLMTQTDHEVGLEIGMVGWEGMLPVCVALGGDVSGQRAVVEVAGTALAINAARLQHQMDAHLPLGRALLGYAQTLFNAVAQTAACNSLHLLEERCARWLLMAHDRVSGNEMRLTHETLARALGVRRPGITVTAQALQNEGLIAYRHGTILVRNRRGLEAAACECYGLVANRTVANTRQGEAIAPDQHSLNAPEKA